MPFNSGCKLVIFHTGLFGLQLFSSLLGDIRKHQKGNGRQENEIKITYDYIDIAQPLQPHDHLCAHLKAHDGSYQHYQAELIVHVAEFSVSHGCDKGFSRHMGYVGTNGKGHGESKDIQPRCYHPGAAHPKKSADNSNADSQDNQSGPEYFHPCDRHEYIQPIHKLPPYKLQQSQSC